MATPSTPPVPPEIDRWNWGAFLLTWIWGIGNNVLIALVALVPIVNFVMMFVLGAKGSSWAWRNKRWDDVAHFKRVQRNWAIAGAIVWLAVIALVGSTVFGVMMAFKSSEVYQQAIAKLNATPEAVQMLGAPVDPGFPSGSMQINGPSGQAELSIPVQGSKAKGTLYVQATKEMGRWNFDRIELEIEGSEERLDLNSGRKMLPRARVQT